MNITRLHRRSRSLAVLLVLFAAAGCAQSAPSQPALEASRQSPSPTPTPTPTTTLIGKNQVEVEEVAAIEAATREYFYALGTGDSRTLAGRSAGELKTLSTWQRILNEESPVLEILKPAAASIDHLTVTGVEGNTAKVEIKGQLDETTFDLNSSSGANELLSTNISGPVTLARGARWQVIDFHRGGKSARGQIYSKVRGHEARHGVDVKVIGADLRPKGTVLIVEVRNTTGLPGGISSPVIRSAGKRLPDARHDTVVAEFDGHSKSTRALFFKSGLRPTTKEFHLLVDTALGCDPVCDLAADLDITVQLIR
jgi:hypothetical protein